MGREDTGELESQVRGSSCAWDIRLISADALGKLVEMKEDAEGPEIAQRIRSLLVPREYTRLDGMIDVMFTTAKGAADAVKETVGPEADADPNHGPTAVGVEQSEKTWQFTDSEVLRALRERIIGAVGHAQGVKFLRKSGALYWNADHDKRVACTLSKEYEQKAASGHRYWYGYHENWDEFLAAGSVSLIVLGCVDAPFAFAIPRTALSPVLPHLDTTVRSTGKYWHLRLARTPSGHFALIQAPGSEPFTIDAYKIDLN